MDQLRHAPANGISDHNRSSIQNQARGNHQTSVPSPRRSRSVGSQGCAVRCRSLSHDGHCTAEPSRTGLGASSQRTTGYGNMRVLTRASSLSALSGVSVGYEGPPSTAALDAAERLSAKKESATVQSGNPLCPFLPLDHFRTPACLLCSDPSERHC